MLLTVVASGLMDGLRHSVSRHDMTSLTPRVGHRRRSRSVDSINKIRVKRLLGSRSNLNHKSQEVRESRATEPAKSGTPLCSRSSLHGRSGYTPSIGSQQGSEYSLSSTVEAAARLGRASMHSYKGEGTFSSRVSHLKLYSLA